MKKMMKLFLMMAALAGMAMFTTSCESEDSDEDITSGKFVLDRDLGSYSGTDTYTWSTTNTQARVEMRVKDFRTGDASIQVYDGNGRLIFSRVYLTPNNVIYTGDNEFVSIGSTATGAAGDWTVKLVYDEFTGEQKLTLD